MKRESAKSKRSRVRVVLGLLATSYLAMGFYFWSTQDEAILKPLQHVAQTPADLEPPLKYEAVMFSSEQSAVHGYWLPADGSETVALYLHGQDATIGKNLHHAECLHQLGCSVLVVDYRGYGATFGEIAPSESSVNHDAEVAWDYLTTTRGIAPDQILIYGHSLGGAIAIELATKHPEAGGLVSESAFTSVKHMARWKYAVTYTLPLGLMLRHHFDSLGKVRRKALPPVLFMHGTADSKVPSFMCKQLYDAALGDDKDILLIEGGEHAAHGEGQLAYQEKLAAFVRLHFKP